MSGRDTNKFVTDYYSVEKIISELKRLGCAVYVNQKRIKIDFSEAMSQFQKNELSLAFKYVSGNLHHALAAPLYDVLPPKNSTKLVRVI